MLELLEQHKQRFEALLSQFRIHFHQNPELSFQEFETSKYIRKVLEEHHIAYDFPWVETGLTVLLGPKDTPILGFRGDMDALPIQEVNEHSYKSKKEGVMHACGHDVHSSILLALAIFLKDHELELKHQVLLVFQPGEELLPGGASLMIKEGLLDKYPVKAMIALHVFPEMEVGNVGVRSGMYMASCDEIHVEIKGKGGHGAMPHLNLDPVTGAAELITTLQKVVSRRANPIIPTVLSFGKIQSQGGATNVIPERVHLEGTFRTLNEEWRADAHALIHQVAKGVALAWDLEIDMDVRKGYPYVFNDEALTAQVKQNLVSSLGQDQVHDLPIRMTGEDFSYFSQKMPVCFFRLGVRNEAKGIVYGVHHAQFDIDERALFIGLKAMLSNVNAII